MEDKVLSVAVPMYHVEAYISKCLDSFVVPEVLKQVEILVIDDGGTDGSAAIAQTYEEKYPGTFRVIHKENGGHGSAVNKGIEVAAGKYFRVVDGDDWVGREGFIHLVRHLENTDADMVLSNYYWVDQATGKRKPEVEEICPGIDYGRVYLLKDLAGHIFMKMHAITYRTEVIRGQPERLDEHCYYVDTEYMLFPLPYVKTVSAIPDYVYRYRIGIPGQSMSAEKLQKQCSQHEQVLERLLKFYRQHKGEDCGVILEQTLARIATSQYKIYLMFPDSHKGKLVELERRLKNRYPEIYKFMKNPAIKVLRGTGYASFGLVGALARRVMR